MTTDKTCEARRPLRLRALLAGAAPGSAGLWLVAFLPFFVAMPALVEGARAQEMLRFPIVGDVVPPYPDGLVSNMGSCIQTPGGAICDRMVGELALSGPDARPHALFAGERHGEGDAVLWRISDILAIPPIAEGYFLDLSQCEGRGLEGVHPIAIVRADTEAPVLDEIAWAAALDPTTGRFVSIETEGVTCENPAP